MPPQRAVLPGDAKFVRVAGAGLDGTLCNVFWPVGPGGAQLENSMPVSDKEKKKQNSFIHGMVKWDFNEKLT